MAPATKPFTIAQAAKLLTAVSGYRYNLSTLFRDFVSVAAISLQNGFEPQSEESDRREAEYLEIVGRYDRDVIDQMAACLSSLISLSRGSHSDVIGELYMELGTNVKGLGQFFTPYHISRLMASISMTRELIDASIAEKGFINVNEPTCGAGGMVVAVADVMTELSYDPTTQLRIVAQDVDRHCCRMTYVNCVLHRIPATIIWGDALKVEEKEVTLTPALYLQLGGMRLSDAA